MTMPYLHRSKFHPPQLDQVLSRPRLLERLEKAEDKGIWLINGQAAQGKTTLLADWIAGSGQATAWISLGPEDAALANLFSSLVGSLVTGLGDPGLEALHGEASLAERPRDPQAAVSLLAGLIREALPGGSQLVLDGLDNLGDNAPGWGLVQALAGQADADHRLIMASRDLPPWSVEDAVMRRRLLSLDNRRLACTRAETAELLREILGHDLDDKQVATVHRLTEGWPGGIVLVSETLAGLDPSEWGALLAGETGGTVRDRVFRFFAQEILNRQPAAIRDFLIRCAPFQALDPAILAEVTGEKRAAEILEEIAQRHLFISSVQDPARGRIYRLHALFREFLQQLYLGELSRADREAYLAAAGRVLAREGCLEEALACQVGAKEHEAAGRTLVHLAPELLRQGRAADLGRWLGDLPRELVRENPHLHLYLCQTRRWTAIRENLAELPGLLESFEVQGDPAAQLQALAGLIEASFGAGEPWSCVRKWEAKAESIMSQMQGDERLLPMLAGVQAQIAFANHVRGDIRKALTASRQAQLLAQRLGHPVMAAEALSFEVETLAILGDFASARERARELEAVLAEHPLADLQAMARIALTMFYGMSGDLERARTLAAELRDLVQANGLLYIYPPSLIYNMLCHALAGEAGRCAQLNAEVQALSETYGSHSLSAAGKLLVAIARVRRSEFAGAWDEVLGALELLRTAEALDSTHWQMGLMTKAMSGRRLGKDPAVLMAAAQEARERLAAMGCHILGAENLLILAILYHDAGDLEAARQSLTGALTKINDFGYQSSTMISCQDLSELVRLAAGLGEKRAAETLTEFILTTTAPDKQEALKRLAADRDPTVRALASEAFSQLRRRRAPRLAIRTLGECAVARGEEPITRWGRQQARHLLLALVALGPGPVAKERVMEALWPEAGPEAAEKNLKVTLHRLRKALEPDLDAKAGSSYVRLEGSQLSLDPETCAVDLWEAKRLRGQGQARAAEGRVKEAITHLDEAARLLQGEFLPADALLEWTETARLRLAQEHLEVLDTLAGLHEKRGAPAKAAEVCRQALRRDPCLEPVCQRLMRLLSSMGLHGQAIRAYQDLAQALERDLGAQPGWVTTSLFERIQEEADRG